MTHMDGYRINHPVLGRGDRHCGFFVIPKEAAGAELRIQSSRDKDWEHVSVSLADRCPTWPEMCWVKDQFWDEDECVMQLHPPKKDYRNLHEFCLHLWKPRRGQMIPRPEAIRVAP